MRQRTERQQLHSFLAVIAEVNPMSKQLLTLDPSLLRLLDDARDIVVEHAVHAAREAGTPEQLQITLSARARPGLRRVELTVRDTGPGMAPDVARRVFDPYFTTKDRGTGLGLAIVKKIILEHRGSIVLTAAPGEGAAFVISLPAS